MSPIGSLLTDPDSFFRDRRTDPSLKGPAVVVTLIAVVGAISSVVQFQATAELYQNMIEGTDLESAGTILQVFQIIGLAFGMVMPYVFWVLYAAIFYGISVVFDGDGDFGTLLALVGWGFVPGLVRSVINAMINTYRYQIEGVPVPDNVTVESMQQFSQTLQQGELVALTGVVGIVFAIWSGVLWTYAVKHARSLSTRNAAITVVIPVLLSVLLSVRTLITAL